MASDDPRNSPPYRGLKAAVIIMGAMIVLAFAILIGGFILKLTGHSAGGDTTTAHYALPPDSKILSLQVTGNRLILGVNTGAGSEVDIFDTDTGRLVGQIKPSPK